VTAYVVRRLIAVLPVMLVVATVSFVLIRLAPGDPASVIAGPYASAEDIAQMQRALGLDQPLPVQLVKWWGRLARGDLGDSIFLRRPVIEAILERLEPTLLLTGWSMLVAVLVGIPVGVLSARYHNTVLDQSFMALALLGLSVPNFLLGLLMILCFGVWLGWLPVAGYATLETGIWPNLRSLIMPALALGLVQSALIARITRSSMLDGPVRANRHLQARAQERDHSHPHRDRHHLRPSRGWGGRHRDRVQHPGAGAPHHLGRAPPRLPRGAGRGAADRRHLHRHQSPRGSGLSGD
jgi:ABC-type dipeptide/oligopeptide/nickel transport system permease component